MLKLKLQYFGHLMQRADSLEKILMMGKTEGKRGWQRMRWLESINNSMDLNLRRQETVKNRGASPWGHKVLHTLTRTQPKLMVFQLRSQTWFQVCET